MKTINIYLTKKDNTLLNEMRANYRVSLSTIAEKLIHLTYKYLKHHNTEYLDYLMNEYIDKTKECLKTSIRPNCYTEKNLYNELIKNKNVYTTNVLVTWIRKDIKKHMEEKQFQKMSNELNTLLSKEKERHWDYNNAVRNQTRAIRENKEYYRKILDT